MTGHTFTIKHQKTLIKDTRDCCKFTGCDRTSQPLPHEGSRLLMLKEEKEVMVLNGFSFFYLIHLINK